MFGRNSTIPGIPQDRNRLNLDDPTEVNYWCDQLDCMEWQLREAVTAAGFLKEDVLSFLFDGIPRGFRAE